jgi:hypothetical protein
VVTEAYDGTSSGCGASKPGVTGGEPLVVPPAEPLVVPPAEPVALFAAGAITSAPPSYGWYSQVQVVPADPGVAARAPGVTPITTAASSQTTSHDRGPYMPVSRHQTVTITAKAPGQPQRHHRPHRSGTWVIQSARSRHAYHSPADGTSKVIPRRPGRPGRPRAPRVYSEHFLRRVRGRRRKRVRSSPVLIEWDVFYSLNGARANATAYPLKFYL